VGGESENDLPDRRGSVARDSQAARSYYRTGEALVFLTNNTTLPALTIAALYKGRWQVEMFFIWIKQHLRIKHFVATSRNAVRSQIWCAIATYVLIAIVKMELKLEASLYTCLQILSVSTIEKTEISCALQPYLHRTDQPAFSNQPDLFDISLDTSGFLLQFSHAKIGAGW
jgi:hypothetical protein